MALRISNREARRLWLDAQGLAETPTGTKGVEALAAVVRRLGFVQLDSIQIVSRAHHHILWSRAQHYREPMFDALLSGQRLVFEHFTHDASLLPIEFYPWWGRQFARMTKRIGKSTWAKHAPPAKEWDKIRQRIEAEGPLSSRDFKSAKADKSIHPWMRPPHKLALDYMWYQGDLATAHRRNFVKYYDLSERIIPDGVRAELRNDDEQLDWLCRGALERLAFATEGNIQRFWDAADLTEVKDWAAARKKSLVPVEIETADGGSFEAFAPQDIETRLKDACPPTSRLRILNPFDPVIRDRDRLCRLFGFDYRLEIFTPAAKRQFGYYVYPLLEGDRFVGRIEVRGDRKKKTLTVDNLWLEPRTRFGADRRKKLDGELERLGRFIGAERIIWSSDT